MDNVHTKADPVYADIGKRLRIIRDRLDKTMDALCKQIGISRSYLSDFERGYKLPTARYLKFLHDKYDVSLDYVFGGSDIPFIKKDEEEPIDFGKMKEEVEEMLLLLSQMPHALFAVLGYYSEYKINNKKLIKDFFAGLKEE
ncbi:MAG: helix-turn-helix transcriptional regulator [bacterium]|nr:helix-turn-helix transcriptional regulator [bacterium]